MSQKIKVSELIPHKDNHVFFDDIEGDDWGEFLESIKTSGVVEPIVITPDKVIVSGHQRVRACNELGIEEIDAEVRIFNSDDEVLKQLIETNIRQRGIGNPSPVKFGLCIEELKRIYGIRNGSAGRVAKSLEGNNFLPKTREDLANGLGIDVRTMENYSLLAKAIPEIQTLVETGIVTPTTARAIIKQLPEFQQKELAEKWIEAAKEEAVKVTKKKAQEEIDKLKRDNKELQDYADELENREPEVVPPKDYEFLKKRQSEYIKEMDALKADSKKKRDDLEAKIRKLEEEKKKLLEEHDDPNEKYNRKLQSDCMFLCLNISSFIDNNSGYTYIGKDFARLPDKEQKSFLSTMRSIKDWADSMLNEIDMEEVG